MTHVSTANNISELAIFNLAGHEHVSAAWISSYHHAGFCGICSNEDMPSICQHKAESATAALCVFDLLAALSMASLISPPTMHAWRQSAQPVHWKGKEESVLACQCRLFASMHLALGFLAKISAEFFLSCLWRALVVAQGQRYGTHHRSLYPHMCSAGGSRGTYLFTSHAGMPLCCWDKRNMSIPVHESKELFIYSRSYPPMPLTPPHSGRDPVHSAIWLESDPGGDLLIGRTYDGAHSLSVTTLGTFRQALAKIPRAHPHMC